MVKKIFIPSGKFMISERKNEIMSAHLGTCVGVTLCDREANIGGLIHLLLPEPTGAGFMGKLEGYAITGMPVFIRNLCEKGASLARLEATIAGGALVGPISKIDIELDIGGRTVEIVEKILQKEAIPILNKETGGFFTCSLNLDLHNWKSRIEPIIMPSTIEESDFKKPEPEELNKAIEKVGPIPQIVLKIIRMVRDETCSMQDIAKEVRQDQVISAKIISLCNSAFFSKKMKVDSIDRALVLLGEKQLIHLIISAAFEDFFTKNGQGYSLCKGGLFNHALATAILSEQLADFNDAISSDIAFTAGLLHDIGKVVLDQYMEKAYPLFYRRTQTNDDSLFIVEQETFGITHDEVGRRLAEKWSLPESLIDVIENHHNPEQSAVNPDLVNLVYLADVIMSRFMAGQELERLDTKRLPSRIKRLGLKKNKFTQIIENMSWQIFNLPYNQTEMSSLSAN